MRIYIKEDKKRMFIPIPLALLKATLSMMQMPLILKCIPEKEKRYIDEIDFKALEECIEILKEYKGLKLVEVRDSKGDVVTITI